MTPTVALPDLDTANKLRTKPWWPVDTLPTIQTHTTDDFVEYGTERPVRAGDRVTFTAPCEVCAAETMSSCPIVRCDGAGRVPVFSAVIDPLPVSDDMERNDEHVGIDLEFREFIHYPDRWWDYNGQVDARPLPADLPITESTRFVLAVRADTIRDPHQHARWKDVKERRANQK